MKIKKNMLLVVTSLIALSSATKAAIVEVDSGFGSLPTNAVSGIGLDEGKMFGGDGIPFDTLSWKTLDTDGDDVADLVLGMSATQRFSSPEVTNDGVSTYFATPGLSEPNRSLWNFNLILGAIDGSDLSNKLVQNNGPFSLDLSYELDPSTNDNAVFAANLLPIDPNFPSILQFSYNLGFDFLDDTIPGFSSGASLTNGESYNPFASGLYSFSASLRDADSSASVDIDVLVEANAPSALALLGLAVLGLVRLRKHN